MKKKVAYITEKVYYIFHLSFHLFHLLLKLFRGQIYSVLKYGLVLHLLAI